jgi:hypothetical protein
MVGDVVLALAGNAGEGDGGAIGPLVGWLTSTVSVPACATTLTLPCSTSSIAPLATFTVVWPKAPSTIAEAGAPCSRSQ